MLAAAISCNPPQPPTALQNPFQPTTLAELSSNSPRYAHELVAFSATIERAEETTQGTWLHLRDGEQRLIVYVPISFGGTLRDTLGEGQMRFEVEVGERKLTPLGTMALEMVPHQISKTHYFDQPVEIAPP